MASEDSGILMYIIWLVWTCLSLTPRKLKNPMYAIVIASQDILRDILSESGLEFAPGLLGVFKAATPPTIAFFKTLPRTIGKRWGVYLLVLEKAGCRPRIYIGSSTLRERGIAGRFTDYDNGILLPRHVKAALDKGFTIVTKMLLYWCPIPAPELQFVVRTLTIAIEAIFSITLKAMKHQSTNYGLPLLFSWSDMEYDGLCSHSPLLEKIHGEEYGATPEQIAAKNAEFDWKRRERKQAHSAALSPATKSEYNKTGRVNTLASWKNECKISELAFQIKNHLDVHNTKNSHLDNVVALLQPPVGEHVCKVCRPLRPFRDSSALKAHRKTQKHIESVAKAAGLVGSSV